VGRRKHGAEGTSDGGVKRFAGKAPAEMIETPLQEISTFNFSSPLTSIEPALE
jgi:hypothetical protein